VPDEVDLDSLVGKHWLTAVDMLNETVKKYGYDEACETLRFVLDGKTYVAVQDPGDGYRSSMEKFFVSDDVVSNAFQATEVIATKRGDGPDSYTVNDTLELRDIANGKLVLSVGTDNTDDYYPSWVGEWIPENLHLNDGKEN
jgi:hypothetical protein